VKIYVAAVEGLRRKKERQDETQFTTNLRKKERQDETQFTTNLRKKERQDETPVYHQFEGFLSFIPR
jgi:hypothetical protein